MYYPCRSLQLAAGTAQRGMGAEIYKHASGTAAPGSLGSIHLPGLYISLRSSTLANVFLISRVLPGWDKCAWHSRLCSSCVEIRGREETPQCCGGPLCLPKEVLRVLGLGMGMSQAVPLLS